MPGCTPSCVGLFSGTDRQKWNYVKSLYLRNYDIDENGDRTSTYNETVFASMYDVDRQEWQDTQPGKPFEKWLQWRFNYGTAQTGNLPQHKKHEHTGHCWMPCPYSTDSVDERTEAMLGFNVAKVDHGNYYMITQSRGNVWGFECTFDGCPYYIGENIRYFYV